MSRKIKYKIQAQLKTGLYWNPVTVNEPVHYMLKEKLMAQKGLLVIIVGSVAQWFGASFLRRP